MTKALGLFFCLCLFGASLAFSQAQEAGPELQLALQPSPSYDPVSLSRFDASGRDLVENLFIGLTRLNPLTGQIEPALAESWAVSADGLTWTFKLRPDVPWVTADLVRRVPVAIRPIVAADVVFALQRACDPRRPSPVNTNLYIIAGCRTLATENSLEALSPEVVAARALDEQTLEIRLLYPSAAFLSLTTQPEMRPLPSEYINDASGQPWFSPSVPISSGPWMVDEWTPGLTMHLIPNPFWPGPRPGNIGGVSIRFDLGPEQIISGLEGQNIDAARLDPTTAADLRLASMAGLGWGYRVHLLGFSFNQRNLDDQAVPSALDLPEVRRALALAIDRSALIRAGHIPATRFTPLGVLAGPDVVLPIFAPNEAQAALAAAGYSSCAQLGVLSMAISNDPADLALAQAIVGQWVANLGCPAENFPLVPSPRTVILDSARNAVDVQDENAARFPLWLITWAGDYPDAQAWAPDALHCEDGYFRSVRPCEGLDALMDSAALESDYAARQVIYNQIEEALFGQAGAFPVVPLLWEQRAWAQQPNLASLQMHGPWQFEYWFKQLATSN
jgi:oligopeptide transport system substrate-binding protein